MTLVDQSITLSEWDTLGPENCDVLRGYLLSETAAARQVVDQLTVSRLLQLTELRHGLQIKAFSHVGRLRVGGLTVTVMPKLRGSSMLSLLRYAYGFRNLNLVSDASHSVQPCGFEDLLAAQLNAEVQELLSRGLRRAYVAQDDRLASPRGRINIGQVARDGGVVTATLPCTHYPRIEDTLLNRALKAGLALANAIASNLGLRRESRRLASLMDEGVSTVQLSSSVLNEVARQLNRLNKSYAPSIAIIRLLYESQGITLEGQATMHRLPGFMFDMNAFFQSVISRFLKDHLTGFMVKDEHSLKKMMRYNPNFNPKRRQSPTPRPDYAVMQDHKLVTLLDAKYRDLWEKPLPPEMLYQLVVYAISQRDNPRSSILYPTNNPLAMESRIDVTEPLHGTRLGQVCLRPVNLEQIADMLRNDSPVNSLRRVTEATRLAFGDQ